MGTKLHTASVLPYGGLASQWDAAFLTRCAEETSPWPWASDMVPRSSPATGPRGCGAARLQEALEDRPCTLSPADLALPAQEEMAGTDSEATRLGRVPGKRPE